MADEKVINGIGFKQVMCGVGIRHEIVTESHGRERRELFVLRVEQKTNLLELPMTRAQTAMMRDALNALMDGTNRGSVQGCDGHGRESSAANERPARAAGRAAKRRPRSRSA